ncbi:MAG: BCAM0308 family protein [Planctomycetota bacterium]
MPPKHADSYAAAVKLADSLVCDDCNVVQNGGRWYWGAPPFGEVRGGRCPACRRIHDRCPAGTIRLPLALAADRDDMVRHLQALAAAERAEHPLERIIAIDTRDDALWITTTGIHIARRLTRWLERHVKAMPRIHYTEEHEMRVEWR